MRGKGQAKQVYMCDINPNDLIACNRQPGTFGSIKGTLQNFTMLKIVWIEILNKSVKNPK